MFILVFLTRFVIIVSYVTVRLINSVPSLDILWGIEKHVQTFSAWALDRFEYLASRSCRCTPDKGPLSCLIHVAYQHTPHGSVQSTVNGQLKSILH